MRDDLPVIRRNIDDLMDAQVQLADGMEEIYERVANLQKQVYTLLATVVGLAVVVVSGYL